MNSRNRYIIRIVVGAVAVVAVIFLINLLIADSGESRPVQGFPTGSTYSAEPDGAELTYRLFKELDFSVARHRRPLLEMDMQDMDIDVIWHMEASVPVSDDEVSWVNEWVSNGGTLVLIANPVPPGLASTEEFSISGQDLLLEHWLDRFGLESSLTDVEYRGFDSVEKRKYVSVLPVPELETVDTISTYMSKVYGTQTVYRFIVSDSLIAFANNCIRDQAGTVMSWSEYGKGRVWLIADPFFFSNLLIQEEDNAIAAVGMILDSRDNERSILFDEYHLGFVRTKSLSDAAGTPLGKGIIYLGIICILALGTAGARFGPVRKASGMIGVSQRAFVNALAGLWQGANASTAVADALWKRYALRQDVRRRGLDTELDRMRKGRTREDELMEVAKKLDARAGE